MSQVQVAPLTSARRGRAGTNYSLSRAGPLYRHCIALCDARLKLSGTIFLLGFWGTVGVNLKLLDLKHDNFSWPKLTATYNNIGRFESNHLTYTYHNLWKDKRWNNIFQAFQTRETNTCNDYDEIPSFLPGNLGSHCNPAFRMHHLPKTERTPLTFRCDMAAAPARDHTCSRALAWARVRVWTWRWRRRQDKLTHHLCISRDSKSRPKGAFFIRLRVNMRTYCQLIKYMI